MVMQAEPNASELDVVMLACSELGASLLCDVAEPIQLGQYEFAVIPCREATPLPSGGSRGQVVANGWCRGTGLFRSFPARAHLVQRASHGHYFGIVYVDQLCARPFVEFESLTRYRVGPYHAAAHIDKTFYS